MAQPTATPSCVRFAEFSLDLRTRELDRNGTKFSLQEQPFQLLVALLEHPRQLVTREELRARLWPSDTFVDFDQGLNKAVNRLREALGESSDQPRFIETLHRRGYRWMASTAIEVGSIAGAGPATEVSPTHSKPSASPFRRLATLAAIVALLLMAGALGWKFVRSSSTPSIRSLAVLPLEDLSSDPKQPELAEGMTDQLITEPGTDQ